MPRSDRDGTGGSKTDRLIVVALAYLALPNLLFLFGWFRLPAACALFAALAWLCWRAIPVAEHGLPSRSAAAVLLVGATALVWALFGGGSHFMYANPDWLVRDAVLGDLVHADWPVHYLSATGQPLLLRSAIGYFLPPAVFGSIFGTAHLDIAVYAWTALGAAIFLLLLPLSRRADWRLAAGLAVVLFFSGMDFVGQIIATGSLPIFPHRLEWWVALSYPSLAGQLLWAPNHALPAWIGTMVLWRHLDGRAFLPLALAVLALTLVWSPFVAVGLFPIALYGWFRSRNLSGASQMPWGNAMAATAYAIAIGAFLIQGAAGINAGSVFAPPAPTHQALMGVSLHDYVLFAACEFLFLAMVLAPNLRHDKALFAIAVLTLASLPLLRFGPSNDALIRLSAPALLVLLVACLRTLLTPASRPRFTASIAIAWLFLSIGALTAFNEYWRAATFPRKDADYGTTLVGLLKGQSAPHYLASPAPVVREWLLRPLREPALDRGRASR